MRPTTRHARSAHQSFSSGELAARLARLSPVVSTLLLLAGFFSSLCAADVWAADETTPAEASNPLVDHREVIVPVGSGERLRIDNLLGHVTVRAWPNAHEIHIIAEKRAMSDEQLRRLRVHYFAWASGEISVDTRVDLGGRERSLPLSGSRVDLVLEVPAGLEVDAKTFGGDLKISGLRAGAKLETTGGRITVSDVRGNVVTHQLRGGQQMSAVEGDVELDGVEGTMDLRDLGGGHLDARLVDGSIHAEDVRSEAVRLVTTSGDIVFIGLLRPARRYELRTIEGNIVLFPGERPSPFEVRARAPGGIASAFPLRLFADSGPVSGGREGKGAHEVKRFGRPQPGREGNEVKQVRALVFPEGVGERAWALGAAARPLIRQDEARLDARGEARPIVELSAPLGRVAIVAARTELPLRP